ncbi:MAG: hypothetical protein PWP51_2075 [Clostridiales bacterium]|jgi:PAS domain-containing protein|nr:hypothetical protein [Clostridiales bacterium]
MKTFFENTKLTYKNLRYAAVISLFTALLIAILMITIYRFQYGEVETNYHTEIQTAVNITEVFVSQRIDSLASKLKILASASEINDFINSPQDGTVKYNSQKKIIENIDDLNDITQIRIIDSEGQERIRINKNRDQLEVVDDGELQNKSNRYYFKDAMEIGNDQIYVSDFDLNIEGDQIVVPYEPTIRFATKLFDEEGSLFGLMIINVDGYEFFKTISEYELVNAEYKEIGIMDCNNYWSLSDTNENDLDQVVLTMEGTDESPFISMVERNATGEFVLDNNNYLYKKLQLSNETMFQIEDGECPWYIVGHYNMALLAKDKQFILRNILPISVILCIIGILISYTIMILLQVKANDNLLLMVSSYISDSSQDGIIILNSRKVIVYCNQVFEEIYSYKKIEF